MEASVDTLQAVSEEAAAIPPSAWAAVCADARSPDGALWAALAARNATPSALGAGVCTVVCGPRAGPALHAASAYFALLASPGCPVFSLFNAGAFEGSLKALRSAGAVCATAAAAEKRGRSKAGRKAKPAAVEEDEAGVADMSEDEAAPAAAEVTAEAAAELGCAALQ